MSVASPSTRAAGGGPFFDAEFDLPALGAALWRKKWKILRPTILVALIALAVVQLIAPKYLSESRVLIEGRDNVFLRPDADKDVVDRGIVDQEAVTSQVQIVLSRDLASEVIAKLKLAERPEFDPARGGISPIKALLGLIGVIRNPMRLTPQERVLDAYYDRLSVYPVEKSRVIVIDFLSEDPQLAARVANAIADAYLRRLQAAKQEQARSASQWLSGEIETMREKVANAEAKVEAFRAKSNLLVGPNGVTLSAQQLGDLTAQLAGARAQKADAEAKAEIIREALRSGAPIESSDILNSELIRRLSEQRVTLRAQLAEQSSSLLDGHPRIKELKAQIADLDQQIRKEAETIARALENDAKVAAARMDSLNASLDQLKTQAAGTNERDVQLRALERDAKSQRDLLESYLAKYREATARDTINSAAVDARVISRAVVSNVPAYPKKLPTVLIATLATMVLCAGWAATRELLSAPIDAVPAVSPAASLATAATAAAAPAAPAQQPAAAEALAARIASIIGKTFTRRSVGGTVATDAAIEAEAVTDEARGDEEAARDDAGENVIAGDAGGDEAVADQATPTVAIPIDALDDVARALREAGESGRRIAVLGAAHEWDTGATAIKLARALAATARVVLVGFGAAGDAAIKAISTDPSANGLAELAAGTASFGDIITKDKQSGLNLITSGRTPRDRIAILSSPHTATTFAALARSYDHVVIDAGAVWGPEMEALGEIAPQAILLCETVNAVTDSACERLLFAGFGDVTVLAGARAGAGAPETAAA